MDESNMLVTIPYWVNRTRRLRVLKPTKPF